MEPTIAITLTKQNYLMALEWPENSEGWDEQVKEKRLRTPSAVAAAIRKVQLRLLVLVSMRILACLQRYVCVCRWCMGACMRK